MVVGAEVVEEVLVVAVVVGPVEDGDTVAHVKKREGGETVGCVLKGVKRGGDSSTYGRVCEEEGEGEA